MQRNLNKITPIVLDYFVALDLGNCMAHNTMGKPLLTGPFQKLNMLQFLGNMLAITTLSSLCSVPVLVLNSVYFGYMWPVSSKSTSLPKP